MGTETRMRRGLRAEYQRSCDDHTSLVNLEASKLSNLHLWLLEEGSHGLIHNLSRDGNEDWRHLPDDP